MKTKPRGSNNDGRLRRPLEIIIVLVLIVLVWIVRLWARPLFHITNIGFEHELAAREGIGFGAGL